jgi:hypothetical protein
MLIGIVPPSLRAASSGLDGLDDVDIPGAAADVAADSAAYLLFVGVGVLAQ